MDKLLAATRDFLVPITAAAPFLAALEPALPGRVVAPARLPVEAYLAAARGAASAATMVLADVLIATDGLAWRQTYTAADLPAAFLARYGWTELIGLRGPFHSDAIALGFLLLGPDTHYPRHRHAAEELYVPIGGTALWERGDAAPALQPPGTVIHHPAWMAHGMRTTSEPLLALYLWRGGDLAAKSSFD